MVGRGLICETIVQSFVIDVGLLRIDFGGIYIV